MTTRIKSKPVEYNDSEIPRLTKTLHDVVVALKPLHQIELHLKKISDQLEVANGIQAIKVRMLKEKEQDA
jgi:hypothetical protein